MEELNKVLAALHNRREELYDLIQSLIRFKTPNLPGQMKKRLKNGLLNA
jgi:hypothetical protein